MYVYIYIYIMYIAVYLYNYIHHIHVFEKHDLTTSYLCQALLRCSSEQAIMAGVSKNGWTIQEIAR